MAQQRILFVDDDEGLQERLAEYFDNYGFELLPHLTGDGVAELVQSKKPGLIILDLNLPGRDGFEVLRDLRRISDIPVIMLTARGDETDRIVGLEIGADDYLPKPFNPRELLARVRAILRRVDANSAGDGRAARQLLVSGDLSLDVNRHLLHYQEKQTGLTTIECKLLEYLLARKGQVLSRDRLMSLLHDKEWEVYDRSIDVNISRLRKKLEQLTGREGWISTVRGAGYMFIEE